LPVYFSGGHKPHYITTVYSLKSNNFHLKLTIFIGMNIIFLCLLFNSIYVGECFVNCVQYSYILSIHSRISDINAKQLGEWKIFEKKFFVYFKSKTNLPALIFFCFSFLFFTIIYFDKKKRKHFKTVWLSQATSTAYWSIILFIGWGSSFLKTYALYVLMEWVPPSDLCFWFQTLEPLCNGLKKWHFKRT
jgi:hypothetical protein